MDLIILKNVNVGDIKALGLLTFVQGELEPPVNKGPESYPMPVESLAPCDVEPARQVEPESAKKGRGRPKKGDPVMTNVTEAVPTPEPPAETPPEVPVTLSIEDLRDACKAAIKAGVKHENLLTIFGEFQPGAKLLADIPNDKWP